MKPKDVLKRKSKGVPQPLSEEEQCIGAVQGKPAKKIKGEKSVSTGFRLAEQSSNIESRPTKGGKKSNPFVGHPGLE